MNTGGLRLDQGPPLAVPASFFASAPVALCLLGALLLAFGAQPLASSWAPLSIAAVHLLTLGVLAPVMLGALYQMVPVVAGAPVPGITVARVVPVLLGAGAVALAAGIGGAQPWSVFAGQGLLTAALALFFGPLTVALVRAPTRSSTVWGMRLALVHLLIVAFAGVWMASGWAGGAFADHRAEWRVFHGAMALLGWVGGLSMAVSWQLVPMFWLARPLPAWCTRGLLALLASGGVALMIAIISILSGADGGAGRMVALAALPSAIAVWVLHPLATAWSLSKARRRHADGARNWWTAALLAGPAALVATVWAWSDPSPRATVLAAIVVVWGWALPFVLGTLSRIVPFLVWFHRYSARVGLEVVPSMKDLLPDAVVRAGLALHVGVGAALLLAAGVGSDGLARLAGAGMSAEGVGVGVALAWVLLPERPAPNLR